MESYMGLIGVGIQTVLFLLGGYAMVIRNDGSNKALKQQVDGIQSELKSLSTIVTTLAVQDERLNNQARRLSDLDTKVEAMRRGEGFVAGSRGLEKEY
jgi:K+/H+ antiporter YhaU regulatory subunit KhtT